MTEFTKTVLIFDINTSGHHATYVRWIIDSDVSGSMKFVLASRPEMFAHPEIAGCAIRKHEIDIPPSLESWQKDFSTIGLFKMSLAIGMLYRKEFLRIIANTAVDFVIVPFIDDCQVGLALYAQAFAGTPWIGITMRTMLHYRVVGILSPPQRFLTLRKFLLRRILKQHSLRSLLTIDPTLAEYARARPQAWMHKVDYLPDPANYYPHRFDKPRARSQLHIASSARLVLIYGEISVRKGIISLLEAAADARCPATVHILMAGRCRDAQFIESNGAYKELLAEGRLHVINGYVTTEVEALILAAADCMWVGYTNFFGMSGIMVLAGRHQLPVLASKHGLIGHLAGKHAIGAIIEPEIQTSVVAALTRLVDDVEFFTQAGKNGALLFDRHRPEVFQKIVRQKIQDSALLAD